MDKYNKSVQHQWFHHATWGSPKYKNEGVGKVLWHSLTEDGKVEIVKIKFGNKIYDNVNVNHLNPIDEGSHSHPKRKKDDDKKKKQESKMSLKLEELVGKKLTEEQFDEAAGKKDACYHKVKARYDVWPSAYASGALVKCRKVGAANWGNKSKKKEGLADKFKKNIDKYNKKAKKSKDYLKKLKKKESVEEAYDIWAEDGSFGYTMTGIVEAEYGGRKVKLGKPMQGDVKKFKVYVKNPKGNVVKVNFGHGGSSAKGKTMKIRKSNPKARANFRARHNCDNPGPRHKARYWSCKKW